MHKLLVLFFIPLLASCSVTTDVYSAVTTIDGTEVVLEDVIMGSPAIINFWAASCAFCKDELPHFEEISSQFPDIAVIGVNLQEDSDTASDYWLEGGYTFPTLLDPGSILKMQFDVFARPTTFFLDADGMEVFRKNGPMTGEEIRRYAEELASSDERIDDRDAKQEPKPSITNLELRNSPVPRVLSDWYYDSVDHLIPLQEILSGGPRKDGIPSIDDPKFLSIPEVLYLNEDDVGILLSISGNHRFYPYSILNWHEIINDTVGGEQVSITYCPLCATGVVYSRLISEGETEFGVSGFLYQSNLLMYDRATDSLWNQVTGQAVVGPKTGEELYRYPSSIVRYGAAKNVSLDLAILSNDTGFDRNYDRVPYGDYADSAKTMFPTNADGDDRLNPKEIVYGVAIDGKAIAFTEAYIKQVGAFQGYLGKGEHKIPLHISFNKDTEEITVTRYFKESPGKKEPFAPVPAYWFSWLSMYPDTELIQ